MTEKFIVGQEIIYKGDSQGLQRGTITEVMDAETFRVKPNFVHDTGNGMKMYIEDLMTLSEYKAFQTNMTYGCEAAAATLDKKHDDDISQPAPAKMTKQTARNNSFLKAARPFATARQYAYLMNLANTGATIEALELSTARNFPCVWDFMLAGTNHCTIDMMPYISVAPVYDQPALPTMEDVEEVLRRPYPTVTTNDGLGQHRNKGMLHNFFATLSLVEG